MAASFQSKDSLVLGVQLKVQELVVKKSDPFVSTSGSTATIDFGEVPAEIRLALFNDDSAGTCAPVVASNQSISGNTVVLTLSAALAAADSILIKYVVSE